ncbi:hypothetical protein [Chryseobacterium mucoviscidosis]|uniref:Uncharacterized protein n=1 Tax=Chryseobacterium mucoviscidosis TaxID=1945581 RepID=A0A202BTB6_9FLAO|nr:hypothetical protein [Chryseobacterium mucoviscidosis]OVE54749.1 hypothetical protein B0E34_18170 [Chryseobacterium mucoviscidosis]
MRKKQFLFILLILSAGFTAYFGYIYSSDIIDYGLFCGDGFTECYEVVKRWIKIHTIILAIIYIIFFLMQRKNQHVEQEIDFWTLLLIFGINIIHWNDINSSWGILALPLNRFLLLYFLFFRSSLKKYLYLSILFYFLIYLNLVYNISELFYYNQKYNSYENYLYIFNTLLLLVFLVLRIRDLLNLKNK